MGDTTNDVAKCCMLMMMMMMIVCRLYYKYLNQLRRRTCSICNTHPQRSCESQPFWLFCTMDTDSLSLGDVGALHNWTKMEVNQEGNHGTKRLRSAMSGGKKNKEKKEEDPRHNQKDMLKFLYVSWH